MGNKVLAVDFDGTCVEHQFPDIGPPMPYAIPVMQELVRRGWKIVLWTCREDHEFLISKKYLTMAKRWFEDNGIPLHGCNEFDSPDMYYSGWTTYSGRGQPRKLWAEYYIDDAIPGGFQGWLNIFRLIEGEEFKEGEIRGAQMRKDLAFEADLQKKIQSVRFVEDKED